MPTTFATRPSPDRPPGSSAQRRKGERNNHGKRRTPIRRHPTAATEEFAHEIDDHLKRLKAVLGL